VSVAQDPALAAFERLLARLGAALRLAAAVVGAVCALIGLVAPLRTAVVAAALAVSLGWAVLYAVPTWRRGWVEWLVLGDVAVVSALCLGYRWLVPPGLPPRSPTWLLILVSCTVVISQFGRRRGPGVLAFVAVPAAYGLGSAMAHRMAPNFVALMAAQGIGTLLLLRLLRGKARTADRELAEQEALRREEAVCTAARAEEREHCRLLHDSVSATLGAVAGGGVAGSPVLRAQARRDLAVIERLQAPAEPQCDEPVGLREQLEPVLARAGITVDARLNEVSVPPRVAAAVAGAVGETLANAVRHARVGEVCIRAGTEDGVVRVELTDRGRGFDLAGVPGHHRGLRESVGTRMALVGGAATVTSWPGSGTRTVLRWPVSGAAADAAADPPAEVDDTLRELVADRYRRGVELAIIWLLGIRHLILGVVGIRGHSNAYHSPELDLVAWAAMAVVWAVASRRLLRRQDGAAVSWLLAAVVLAAAALVVVEVRPGYELTGADWVLSIAGWFWVLVLLRRPFAELVTVLAVNLGLTLLLLIVHGTTDRLTLASLLVLAYAIAALQVAFALMFRGLDGTARRAAATAQERAAVGRRGEVAQSLHRRRLERYRTVRRSAAALLTGLAGGELDPADRATQRACAVEASRLRGLFAETDDVPDPVLHELRACADLAYDRGVPVDLQVVGHLPELPRAARRALTEAPLYALAAAEREARVTVLGRDDEVAVSVLTDAAPGALPDLTSRDRSVTVTVQAVGTGRWVEARWHRHPDRPAPTSVQIPASRREWDPRTALSS
jgi:histidine kinase-like protein